MKKLFIPFLLVAGLFAQAQQNVFHERKYWKSNPTIEQVQKEVASGADLIATNERGFDATAFAILENAPMSTIEFLLKDKGNGVNKLTHDGRTYIFWAASAGNDALVQKLLDMGAKADLRDGHNNTPLLFAASSGNKNLKVFDVLLKNNPKAINDTDEHGATAILLAASSDKNFKVINYLSEKGLSLEARDEDGNTAFNYAAKTGDIAHLGNFIKKGVPHTNEAFIMAAQGTRGTANKLETYQFLKSLGLDPAYVNKEGNNALHFLARKKDHVEIINWFLAQGANPVQVNAEGVSPLMNAVGGNDLDVVSIFLSKTKDINATDKKGNTALTLSLKNKPEVIQAILDKGAKTDIKNKLGDNLSSYIVDAFNGKDAAAFQTKIDLLKKAGYNFYQTSANGNTVLHYALAKNDLNLLKAVDLKAIDVNAVNKEGMTALHKAALIGKNTEILQYLIASGAKKSIKTDMGETAYDLASDNEAFIKNNVDIKFLK